MPSTFQGAAAIGSVDSGASPISALEGSGWSPRVGSQAVASALRRAVGRKPIGSSRAARVTASAPAS
jgi:hypothetical protein